MEADTHERQRDDNKQRREADQDMGHVGAQDAGNQPCAAETGKADPQEDERERIDGEMDDIFEERPQVGRQRELPAKNRIIAVIPSAKVRLAMRPNVPAVLRSS